MERGATFPYKVRKAVLFRIALFFNPTDLSRLFNGHFILKDTAVGHLPAWWEGDHADMKSGLVPLQDGTLERGIY